MLSKDTGDILAIEKLVKADGLGSGRGDSGVTEILSDTGWLDVCTGLDMVAVIGGREIKGG